MALRRAPHRPRAPPAQRPPLARCRRAGPGHAASRRADGTRRVVHGAAPTGLCPEAPRWRRGAVGTRPALGHAVITVSGWADTVLICIVLTSFVLLGSSRLGACIRVVAFQGVLLGFLTLAGREDAPSLRAPILALVSTGLKGVAFPWLLLRALRDADVRREVEPFVGYSLSLLIGTAFLAGSLWLAGRLPLPSPAISPLVVPVAFFTMLVGLFLIV